MANIPAKDSARGGCGKGEQPMSMLDPERVARHVIQSLGGHEKAFQTLDEDFAHFMRRWNQDLDKIGRILRAHLFVEHFLTEYLQAKCSGLRSLEKARLTFAQKTALVEGGDATVAYLIPGIRRLNAIRNRIAHSLHASVTEEDVGVFVGIRLFMAMRNESAKRSGRIPSNDPIDLIDAFALHAGSVLHQGPVSEAFAEAINRTLSESSEH